MSLPSYYDYGGWIESLLTKLGAPQSKANRVALYCWAASEGVPIFENNPLAASDQLPGSHPPPRPYTMPEYPSLDAATSLYVRKLDSSIYHDIGVAIRQNLGTKAIWSAINRSPWCAHCQGGKYPVVLYNYAGATLPPPTPAPTPSPPGPVAGPPTPVSHGVHATVSGKWSDLMWSLQHGMAHNLIQAGIHSEKLLKLLK